MILAGQISTRIRITQRLANNFWLDLVSTEGLGIPMYYVWVPFAVDSFAFISSCLSDLIKLVVESF